MFSGSQFIRGASSMGRRLHDKPLTTDQSPHEHTRQPHSGSTASPLAAGLRAIAAGQVKEGARLLVYTVGYWRFLPNGFVLEEFERLPSWRASSTRAARSS